MSASLPVCLHATGTKTKNPNIAPVFEKILVWYKAPKSTTNKVFNDFHWIFVINFCLEWTFWVLFSLISLEVTNGTFRFFVSKYDQKQSPGGVPQKCDLQKLPKIHRKQLCQKFLFIKVTGYKPESLLRRDPITGTPLWILRTFLEYLFYRTEDCIHMIRNFDHLYDQNRKKNYMNDISNKFILLTLKKQDIFKLI